MAFATAPLHWIVERDDRVMLRLDRWRSPRYLRLWMIYATRIGDGWLWYALAGFLSLYGGDRQWRALIACTMAIFTGVVLFSLLKRICRRPRPRVTALRSTDAPAPPDQFSFPSGHTITAFAGAVSLMHFYPEAAPLLLLVAASIAASRVLLGMHYPSDVLAGALIGTGLGYSAYLLMV
jgi:undecaprenyl-diphosphatase